MRINFIFILFLPVILYSQNKITGKLIYDLPKNELSAKLSISFDKKVLTKDTLRMTLNTKAEIQKVEGESVKKYDFDEFFAIINARSNYLTILFDTTSQKQNLAFSIEYKIQPYTDPLWKDQWFEFYSEIRGFPLLRNVNFDLDLLVELPDEFNYFGSSALQKLESGIFQYRATKVENGPNIFGGKEVYLKEFSHGPFPNLKVYSYFDEYGMMDSVGHYIEEALAYYHKSFAKNDPQSDFTFAILPYITNVSFNRPAFTSYRYFRQGDRFLNGIPRTLKTPYHELAHLWWTNAASNTYDNWINESFAEYSAYLAIRELHGEDLYQKYVESAKSKGKNFGPIVEYKPFRTYIFYTKGAYIVYELHQKLGEEDYIKFTQKLIDQKVDKISTCIEILKHNYSEEIADWLYNRLRE